MKLRKPSDASLAFSSAELSDLDPDNQLVEGGGGGTIISNDGTTSDMSICLEPNTVLTNQVSANHASASTEASTSSPRGSDNHVEKVSVAKIIMANNNQSIQSSISAKVVNPPLITVMNTPITVVKTLCSTTPSHFTLVNSAVKSPTITLVNAPPITVVKNITSEAMKPTDSTTNNGSINNGSLAPIPEKSVHNVFVKKSIIDSNPDVPQSHKILTANTFPTNNVVQNVNNSMTKTVNGQKPVTQNKVKILSNVVMSSAIAGPSNLLLNKTSTPRFYPQQKVANNGTQKYMGKPPPNNIIKNNCPPKTYPPEKVQQRLLYSTHKGQYKTVPSMPPNFASKPAGIKTLSPQGKGIPGQVQRTSSGLRTIPPQRPPKPANKTNYIGKHAVQAQKLRPPHMPPKIKSVKHPSPLNSYHNRMPQSSQVTFNQALTAQILETLGQDSSKGSNYETSRYDNFNYMENKIPPEPPIIPRPEYKPQSNLDTLSFVCQAVLLDHNYNATLPAEIPPTPTISTSPQINGIPSSSLYSPGTNKRGRTTSSCSATTSAIPAPAPVLPINEPSIPAQDDDAASDISCNSDRKMDTEGEETDTAPEAEAVANDDPGDRYGDYVTRCICGFIHDDGYMIECDQCKVWQHVRCVIKNKKVPDDYLCEICDPTKQTDKQKARVLQQQWMREIQEREARLRKALKEIATDTDSSDGEMMPNNNNLAVKGRRKSDNNRQVRQRRDSSKEVVPRRPLKRKERKIVKRKLKSNNKSHSDDEKRENQPTQLPQLRQWIDNYEEAVTNHYSPELRARISNIRINGAHSELNGQVDPSVHKCKVQNLGAGIKCLLATCNLPSGVPVVELRGKYMLSTQHRTSHGGSLTTRQQRPGPFLFFYRLHRDNTEVCVDTRTYGNSARFVRRSCQPNAELRHCIEKGVLHLYIVTIIAVEKNLELTIKHESHDLAVVGSTEIPCACGNPERCLVNRVKKNGENLSLDIGHRKRRPRRTVSVSMDSSLSPVKPKEEPIQTEVKQEKPDEEETVVVAKESKEIKMEIEEEVKDVKPIKEEPEATQIKEEPEEVPIKEEVKEEVKEEPPPEEVKIVEEKEEPPPPPPVIQPVNTRRASAAQKALLHEPEEKQEKPEKESPQAPEEDKKDKKLSREERKLQAIMKAIERMERQEQRKQEHQAKQAHRRESEPSPNTKDEEKCPARAKRRKRKGRARTVSTNSQSGRRNRLDSADSLQATSSDETLLSPSDNNTSEQNSSSKAAGLLLSLSSNENTNSKDHEAKSPERVRDLDSNSNSAHSSPETPLSSACLLVAAAVEPLEPGFKFPKTKKGLMNEWLNKGPEVVQPASQISPSALTPHIMTTSTESTMNSYENNPGFFAPAKNLAALAQAASYCDSPTQPQGSAKKRWLRQAISEDQCDSPCSRPDSPPLPDAVAPPKKRRLPRETISTEGTPPTTPTRVSPPPLTFRLPIERKEEGKLDQEDDFTKADFRPPLPSTLSFIENSDTTFTTLRDGIKRDLTPGLCDPRLTRFSDQLVGTVEKTLSILGFDSKKPETITPTKRKLSITEYLQRKKINTCDKAEESSIDETTSATSQSPKPIRNRSNSSSSNTSLASSDDEMPPVEISGKAISAFNSEPTELERQRENVSLRVKKALGIPLDETLRTPQALAVSSRLKADLQTLSLKTSLPLQSPTFPIPGSASEPAPRPTSTEIPPQSVYLQSTAPLSPVKKPEVKESAPSNSNPVMFYTPDDEEAAGVNIEEGKFMEKSETTSYVPPFNNPLYPNSSYTTYGSVIDDDVPYEGRNPSPPPNLGGVQCSKE